MLETEEIKRKRKKALQVYKRLSKLYPDAHCTLNYRSPFELLIMTILASQCTDERVNQVCKTLFQELKSPQDFINIGQKELEKRIYSVGFYKNKAKHIINTCKQLINQYNGNVPDNMNDILRLDGVGRKTANVILGECFKKPAIIVDTHCGRLAKRIGLTSSDNPEQVEKDLSLILPKNIWTFFSHLLVFHGRNICHSRKPQCNLCIINKYCNFYSDSIINKQNNQYELKHDKK